jgi:hypothetical protein
METSTPVKTTKKFMIFSKILKVNKNYNLFIKNL